MRKNRKKLGVGKGARKRDQRYFSKNAAKTQSANLRAAPMRGGFRA